MSHVTIIEPEKLEYLPAKTLLSLVQKSQRAAKNFKAFRETIIARPELFRAFEELDVEPSFQDDNDYIVLQFTGDGNKLRDVWKALRQHDYRPSSHPKTGDTQATVFWESQGVARIFMYFTSSVCRRVQVGTKMQEVPIYETHCGELPELDTPENEVVAAEVEEMPF